MWVLILDGSMWDRYNTLVELDIDKHIQKNIL